MWAKEANAERIIICSDEVAKDTIRKTLLLQVGPPGVKVSVVSVAKAVRVYNNPKYEKDTVFSSILVHKMFYVWQKQEFRLRV